MKTKIISFLAILLTISNFSIAQLKIDASGHIGMGTNYPNPGYKCHIKGDLLLTTYPEIPPPNPGFVELFFRLSGGGPGVEIGTNTGNIAFYSPWPGYMNVWAHHYFTASDSILKTNINPIQNGLNIIRLLKPSFYNLKDSTGRAKNHKEYGFIAQDVAVILPEITDTMRGIRLIDYSQITPFTVSAIKQIDSTVIKLQLQVADLTKRIIELENKK